MKFSVIIPIYNSEKYLSECIESVLHQSYQDFELILVNDGSTDRSSEICENYAGTDSRIRVYHQSNAGVSTARNEGLKSASGDWILFLDSDDLLNCHTLNYIHQVISLNGDIDLIQFDLTRERCDASDKTDICNCSLTYHLPGEYCEKVRYNVCAGGSAIKTSILRNNSISFDTSLELAEDQVFMFRVMQVAQLCCKIPLPLYYYRHNTSSATNNAKYESMVRTIHKLEYYKSEMPLARSQFDRVIISFIYSIVISGSYSNEYICELMNSVSVRSVKNVTPGVKLFFYISKISKRLSIKVLRVIKNVQKG